MEYKIRQMNNTEYPLLNDFLYEAIYVPNGIEPPPKTVIYSPELQVYIADFGKKEHDIGTALLEELIATLKSKGYSRISLSVQKDNYAVKMYQQVGFTILKEVDEEYIMVIAL